MQRYDEYYCLRVIKIVEYPEYMEKAYPTRYKLWIRVISAILIVTFVNQDIIWAQGQAIAPAESYIRPSDKRTEGVVIDPRSVHIPRSLAISKDRYHAGGKTIINIQDAHSSLGAQESIVSILDALVKDYDLKLVAIEGSTGQVDTSLLRTFPVADARREAAEGFMREGRMSAGEFYASTSSTPVTLYGIEDDSLYRKNVAQFCAVSSSRSEACSTLEAMRAWTGAIKEKAYSKKALEIEKRSSSAISGNTQFRQRLKYIRALAHQFGIDVISYPNLRKLYRSLAYEKRVDFDSANKERDLLISELSKRLNKDDLRKVMDASLSLKNGSMPQGEYYNFISALASKAGIPPRAYEAFALYGRYLREYESADISEIFAESSAIEAAIKDKLFVNDEQRRIADVSRYVETALGALRLELSRGEADRLRELAGRWSGAEAERYLKGASLKYGIDAPAISGIQSIDPCLAAAIDFYDTAQKRESAILSNTIRAMERHGQNAAALITGGYHSQGLSSICRQKSTSYLIIMPRFDPSRGDRPYAAILTNRASSYAPLLSSGQHYLAATSYFGQDSSVPEELRFDQYRADFKRIILKAAGKMDNRSTKRAAIKRIMHDWQMNYARFYDEYQAGLADGSIQSDFRPRPPKRCGGLFSMISGRILARSFLQHREISGRPALTGKQFSGPKRKKPPGSYLPKALLPS